MRVTLSPVVRTFGTDDPSLFPSPSPAHSPQPLRRALDAMPKDGDASLSFAGSDGRWQDGQAQPDDTGLAAFADFPSVAALSPSLPDDLVAAAETLALGAGDLEPALQAWLAPLSVKETSPASSPVASSDSSLHPARDPSPPAPPLDIFGALAPDAGGADLPDRAQLADRARASLDAPAAPPLCQQQMRLAFDIAGSDVVGVTPSGRLQVCFQPALARCEPLYVDLDRDAARALARQILQMDDDGIPDGVAGIFNASW